MSRLHKSDDLDSLKEAMSNIDIPGIRQACDQAARDGTPPLSIIEAMFEGMQIVGRKFDAGEYFLTELIAAGEAMTEQLQVLEPQLHKTAEDGIGCVVLGTVQGDLHSIGKDICGMFMKASGFKVVDLGVDVSAEKFVEAVEKHNPAILGMSALLTVSMPEMETVISQLKSKGLRNHVKIIVGGAPLSSEYAKKIGADAFGANAIAGVDTCKGWLARGDRR